MPLNTSPIYSAAGVVSWANLAAANTAKDGTGAVGIIFTANATYGGYVERITVRPLGTIAATVVRLFINNGATNAVAANNSLFIEQTLVATVNSEVAAIPGIEIPLRFALDPNFRLLFTLGTYATGSVQATAFGGTYFVV